MWEFGYPPETLQHSVSFISWLHVVSLVQRLLVCIKLRRKYELRYTIVQMLHPTVWVSLSVVQSTLTSWSTCRRRSLGIRLSNRLTPIHKGCMKNTCSIVDLFSKMLHKTLRILWRYVPCLQKIITSLTMKRVHFLFEVLSKGNI